MVSQKKLSQAINEIYTRVYKLAEPSADFEELKRNSPKNEMGQINIPFNDYEIEMSVYEDIFSEVVKKYRIYGYQRKSLAQYLILGALPKFKKETSQN